MNSEHYTPEEFQGWHDRLSPRLLAFLDSFRHRLGVRVRISAAAGAVGRNLGPDVDSRHNFDKWGEVQAADVFVEGVHNRAQAARVIDTAVSVGFTGVGVYPDWKNNQGELQVGFHLDVRGDRSMGDPAMWGRLDSDYVSIDFALSQMG